MRTNEPDFLFGTKTDELDVPFKTNKIDVSLETIINSLLKYYNHRQIERIERDLAARTRELKP